MNKKFRILLSIVIAVATFFVFVSVFVLLNIREPGSVLKYLVVIFAFGVGSLVNSHLKKKYPPQDNEKEKDQ